MLAVRFVALAALVVWLGGMVTLGLLVAPSVFGVLQASDPTAGRALAGAVFGETLRTFHLLAYACGAVIFISLFVMKFIGPPPAAFTARATLVAAMLGIAVYSGVPVTEEIEQIQASVGSPVGSLPPGDPRRVRFDRLHRTSTLLMAFNIGLGSVLLFWYVREPA
jgi:hypothetical protein